MKIFKPAAYFIIAAVLISCGIKTDPIPKSSVDIPYPSAIDYNINPGGISIYNGSGEWTLFVERADEETGFITLSSFKRVALINPKQVFTDTEVENGKVYKYRFRHYYGKIKTYSPALVKTIKYYEPIKLENAKIVKERNKICASASLSSVVTTIDVMINGTKADSMMAGQKKCFNMPETSVISVMMIPYNSENNPGKAYETTITQNAGTANLPPQNVIVRRSENDIVITWDEAENASYIVYADNNGKLRRIAALDVSLFRYKAKGTDNCVDFKLSTVRKGKESKKIGVSACR